MMEVNEAGIALIKEFEGLRLEAYPDPASGGEPWTIGYGTTTAAAVGIAVKPGMTITEAQADQYLQLAVAKFAVKVREVLSRDPTPNQFAAMVSLCYNIGPGNFRKSSVLRHFNAGKIDAAATAFASWNKARVGGVLTTMTGLTRRRAAEAALFKSVAPSKEPEVAGGWWARFRTRHW